jgi:hypothetical protein
MIHTPDLYINSLPYRADVKTIVKSVAMIRLQRQRCQPSWNELCRWIGKSRRSLAKLMKSESFREVVVKIRRGKKQTNLYYLAPWLWQRLIVGRRAFYATRPHGAPRRTSAAQAAAGFAAIYDALRPAATQPG